MTGPVAYLCSRYPAISHAFVLREVAALRDAGVAIETITIRRCDESELLSNADRREAERTWAVLPASPAQVAGAHITALRRAPGAYFATLLRALRLSPPGARGLLWQLFYFAESMLVWRRCTERGISHIHVHFANVAADVALLATTFGRGAGGPRSWSFTMHGPTEFLDVEGHRLPQKAADAAFVACISDFARSQLMALTDPGCWEDLHIVHCGIHPGPAPGGRAATDGQRRGDGRSGDNGRGAGDPPALLSVGQLLPRKGHAVLVEALAELAAEGVELDATIVGAGPERNRLEEMARGMGIGGRVRFTGALGQDELPALYEEADIFCLASFAEGVPVVLMEAMAHAVPVVATRINGVPELVADGETGLLVAPGRAADLAAAIRRLTDDRDSAARLGAAGREKVAAEFDQSDSAAQLKALFESVADR